MFTHAIRFFGTGRLAVHLQKIKPAAEPSPARELMLQRIKELQDSGEADKLLEKSKIPQDIEAMHDALVAAEKSRKIFSVY